VAPAAAAAAGVLEADALSAVEAFVRGSDDVSAITIGSVLAGAAAALGAGKADLKPHRPALKARIGELVDELNGTASPTASDDDDDERTWEIGDRCWALFSLDGGSGGEKFYRGTVVMAPGFGENTASVVWDDGAKTEKFGLAGLLVNLPPSGRRQADLIGTPDGGPNAKAQKLLADRDLRARRVRQRLQGGSAEAPPALPSAPAAGQRTKGYIVMRAKAWHDIDHNEQRERVLQRIAQLLGFEAATKRVKDVETSLYVLLSLRRAASLTRSLTTPLRYFAADSLKEYTDLRTLGTRGKKLAAWNRDHVLPAAA